MKSKTKKQVKKNRNSDSESRSRSRSRSNSSSNPTSSSESSSSSKDKAKTQLDTQKALFKQCAKLDKIKAQMLKRLGYTDEDNPYGDKELAKTFIWKQKLDKGDSNLSEEQLKKKMDEMITSIERLKEQRRRKELEKIKLEEEKNRLSKERQAENYQAWIDSEENFFEKVEKLRPLIRISQNREVSFDKFVRIACIYKGQIAHQKTLEHIMQQPSKFVKQQNLNDQKMILQEAKKQFAIEYEQKSEMSEYWASIISIVVAEVEWRELKEREPNNTNLLKYGITKEFRDEIKEMFVGKTKIELEEMEKEINDTLNSNEVSFKLDFDYWEKIVKKLKVYKAKATLKVFYDKFCRDMKYKSMRQTEKIVLDDEINTRDLQLNVERMNPYEIPLPKKVNKEEDVQILEVEYVCVSPIPQDFLNTEEKIIAIKENDDLRNLEHQRIEALKSQLMKAKVELEQLAKQLKVNQPDKDKKQQKKEIGKRTQLEEIQIEGLDQLAQQMFEYERSKPLEEDEVYFNEMIPTHEPSWSKKYKPKRPQYFNRVKMGYDWNLYNKTHYDIDNPPPKVVQGYKFNIFYPDLIDKSKAPQYILEPCEQKEFCLIRFVSGAPYEDIAFKIINKEWDYSDKMGFKSVFSRGILHLYFNFKKPRYRR